MPPYICVVCGTEQFGINELINCCFDQKQCQRCRQCRYYTMTLFESKVLNRPYDVCEKCEETLIEEEKTGIFWKISKKMIDDFITPENYNNY